MPIRTVERNLPGFDASASARRDPMTLRSIIARSRAGRDDTMASSDIASRPLRMMSAATTATSRMSMTDEIAIGRGWFQSRNLRASGLASADRYPRGRIDAYHRLNGACVTSSVAPKAGNLAISTKLGCLNSIIRIYQNVADANTDGPRIVHRIKQMRVSTRTCDLKN